MGLGEFLDGAEDWVSRLALSLGASPTVVKTNTPEPAPTGDVTAASVTGAAFKPLGIAFEPVMSTPYVGDAVGNVMKVLDAPRRAIDTALISGQHADAVGQKAGKETDWSEFFNKGTWSKAWNLASFTNATAIDTLGVGGTTDQGLPRTTGGQILMGGVFGGNSDLDPFNEADARQLQDAANSTWYGRTMTTAADLGESFISIPGTGMVSKARKGAGVATIADAERAAVRFNEVGVVDRTATEKAATKAKDVLHLSVNTGAQNVDNLVARQVEGLRPFDGVTDEAQVLNGLKARMEHAPDGEVAKLANIFTEINRRIDDPVVRERVRTNAFLATQGSTTAKAALIQDAPLLAKNFEGLTSTPREASAFTELYSQRLTPGEDVPLNQIVESVWTTAGDRAEMAALKDHVRTLKTARKQHDKAIADLRAMKPRVRETPEAQHVKAKREELTNEVRKLQGELKDARVGLHGTKRWAGAAAKDAKGVGATNDVVDFNQAIGEHRRRVEDVQARLAQAKADRDLLNQTPLHDPTLLEDWKAGLDQKVADRTGIIDELDQAKAWRDDLKTTLDAKQAEIRRVAPYLDASNARVSEILDIAGPDSKMALVGDAKPTLLNRLKANVREQLGAEHMIYTGDGNTIVRIKSLPTAKARRMLAPQARGSIALNELGLGVKQLDDTMVRAKVFTPEEIAATRNELIRTPAGMRAGVVARLQNEMYQRVVVDWARKNLPELTEEQALAHARDLADLQRKAWGQGNDWAAKAADEQLSDDIVFIRDIDGEYVGYDGASLRSHLADHAPILDPWEIRRQLDRHGGTIKSNIRNGLHATANAHDMAVSIWKVSALVRPGLYVRSMLDTGPRALASMSAAETLTASMNGVANLAHNRGLRGLSKIGMVGSPDKVAARLRYSGMNTIKVGGHEFQLGKDRVDLASMQAAATKGNSVHDAVYHDMGKAYDDLSLDRSSWKRLKSDNATWHIGYQEYADQLLASPTARKIAELTTKVDDTVDIAALREQIKDSPEFANEYRLLAQHDMTRSEFLDHLIHQVDLMFPSEKLLEAAKHGGLNKKLIDREIPREARFDVPSPEQRVIGDGGFKVKGQKILNGAFKQLLDNPDMYLARMPVMNQVYKRRLQVEYAALAKVKGNGYRMTDKEAALIDSRARNAAIGYVRHTFFDTTRYTGAHRALARFSPFIAAWEDAMISWGRLIYDDPRRLTKLVAGYNAPYTIAASQNIPLVVDQDGKPITRGSDHDGVFVAIPAPVARFIAKRAGKDPNGVGEYRMRLDAINSIAQGETWWLPGVGPNVALPAAWALGSDKVISREAALDLVDTDSPVGKAILKSVFLGGEIPASDPKSLAMSALPGSVRTAFTEFYGEGKTRTQVFAINQLVLEAQAKGERLDDKKWAEISDRAERMANATATVRFAMSFGLGFTGSATVDAQFYVDQMHIIQAMPEDMRQGLTAEEFFAKEYPEAADLDWSVTKNETGINATVNAAKSEARLAPVLKRNPDDVGWMVLGRDNVVDPEFSRTAYSFQKGDGNRVYQDAEAAKTEAQAAVGYKQLNAWSQQVADALVAQGFDPEQVTQTPEYRDIKKALREYIVQSNPAFAQQSSQFVNRRDYYYSQAQRLSTSGPLKDRSDMVTFRDYDAARQQVLDHFGIKSFTGTTEKYDQAKTVMQQVGAELADRDLGFQQMWDKFLEREVE